MLSRVIELCGGVVVLLAGLLGPGGSAFGRETSSGRCGGPFAGEGVLRSNGVDRHYRVRGPRMNDGRDLPLIIAPHGRGSTGAALERESGLSKLRALVAYPQALPGADGQAAWAGAPCSSADEVVFVANLIDDLDRLWCVAEARLRVAGLSNGGGLAATIGCPLADRLAGYATAAGAFHPEAGGCSPARPMPAVNFHGADDRVGGVRGQPRQGTAGGAGLAAPAGGAQRVRGPDARVGSVRSGSAAVGLLRAGRGGHPPPGRRRRARMAGAHRHRGPELVVVEPDGC